MLIVLEGLEGVGKTTLGKMAAERLLATYLKSPPDEMNGSRDFIARQSDARCRFYFYLSSLYAMQGAIRASINQGTSVIADRYLVSTIAYHDLGRTFAPPRFDGSGLYPPTLSVHVRCDPATREKRLGTRGFQIFDRNKSEAAAIEAYFSQQCDLEFWNDAPLDASIGEFIRILSERLAEDVKPFG